MTMALPWKSIEERIKVRKVKVFVYFFFFFNSLNK